MKFKLIVNNELEYAYLKHYGIISIDCFESALNKLCSHPVWKKGFAIIYDATEINFSSATTDHMVILKEMISARLNKMGTGFLAFFVKDKLGYGFTRVYELSGGDLNHKEISTFFSKDEAVNWILKKTCRS